MTPAAAFRHAILPPAIRTRLQQMAAADAEIRALHSVLGEQRIRAWAHAIGAGLDPVLARLVPPVPPRELRLRVGEPEAEVFLWTGIADLDVVLDAWEAHGQPPQGRRPAILDFGCGCGRLLRLLAMGSGIADVHGAEPDPDLAGWCAASLPEARTSACAPEPPLPHADGTFDLVFAVSVLPHLAEDSIRRWVRELGRLLAPGGVLVATTHGPHARAMRADEAELERLVGLDARARRRDARTFLDEPRVRHIATAAGLEVAAVVPGGLRGWQDVLVARPIPAATG